jgi:hypothetical protein
MMGNTITRTCITMPRMKMGRIFPMMSRQCNSIWPLPLVDHQKVGPQTLPPMLALAQAHPHK